MATIIRPPPSITICFSAGIMSVVLFSYKIKLLLIPVQSIIYRLGKNFYGYVEPTNLMFSNGRVEKFSVIVKYINV
jgi:hypothetical protein